MVKALDKEKGFLLFVLCLAQFTLSADVANLSISTSTLVDVFNTDIASIQILGIIQPLVGAALMLSASMFGLIIGWRRLLILGTSLGFISTLGFIFLSDIDSISFFVRPLTGLGSAFILPAVLALVVAHFPGKSRALGFGLMAAATGFAAAIVPLLSGWLHDNVSWQWPFAFIALCYLATLIGAIARITPIHTNQPAKFDIMGSVVGGASITILFFGLIKLPYWGVFFALRGADIPNWLTFILPVSPALLFLVVGLCLFACFIVQQLHFEKRYGHALLPLHWLTHSASRQGFFILTFMYMILGGSSFVIVTYLQVAVALSSSHSGGIILLFSAFMIVFSILTPVLFKNVQPKPLCQAAFVGVILSGGTLWLSSGAEQIILTFYAGMALLGTAMGILASQCPVIITSALGERDAEQSGGLQATLRNIGLVIGISLFGGINQWGLEKEIRFATEFTTHYPNEFHEQLQNVSHIPYMDNARLRHTIETFALDNNQVQTLLNINANARLNGFDHTMFALMITAWLGFLVSTRLNRTDGQTTTLSPIKE